MSDCEQCHGAGWYTIPVTVAECCQCPTETGECCNQPVAGQGEGQEQCAACHGTGKQEHTPGMLVTKRASQPSDGGYDYAILADIDGSPLCVAEVFEVVAEGVRVNSQANAARIVHTWNCHDELLGAAEEAAENPGGDYYLGLHCGLEDRDITDRYDAADYGWEKAFEYIESILLPAIAKAKGEAQ